MGVSLPRLLLGDQLILRWSSIVDHFNLNVYDIIMHYSNLSLNMVVFLIIKKKTSLPYFRVKLSCVCLIEKNSL